ncbi:hypothetical protein SAMN06296036_108191 [Pseudobacteriovorax antillogorgiicola]|uniref:Uncharacterized protein n=1 Tax=Pseudobacteriovorax antillogorgiicola TaxID=1513793 RepID=A0A1Y6BT17_9BACT|nr:hypothetical protein EDD56_10856 [Pseudobacteriovorax antillogorgiicola]SMF27044.1 hypothetical protein SAMN06296036_108191 [Pseudobacteriovorax antillogorgiicola]
MDFSRYPISAQTTINRNLEIHNNQIKLFNILLNLYIKLD